MLPDAQATLLGCQDEFNPVLLLFMIAFSSRVGPALELRLVILLVKNWPPFRDPAQTFLVLNKTLSW